jgi:hypothetical protein
MQEWTAYANQYTMQFVNRNKDKNQHLIDAEEAFDKVCNNSW